jgi:hypothetical protein
MTGGADIFGESDFDVSDFDVREAVQGPPREKIREVAEKTGFKSREPEANPPAQPPPDEGIHKQRRYRTGRNVALSTKVTQAVLDDIHKLTDEAPPGQQVVGLTIERAVAALKRELAGQG